MKIAVMTIGSTIINVALIIGIIFLIIKGIKGIKDLITRQKALENKVDIIIDNIENIQSKDSN